MPSALRISTKNEKDFLPGLGQGLIQCLESEASEFVYLPPLSWTPLGPPTIFSNMHLISPVFQTLRKGFLVECNNLHSVFQEKPELCPKVFLSLCDFLPKNLLSVYIPLSKIQKSYHGTWGQLAPAPACKRPVFREQRNRDGRYFRVCF